MSNEKYSVKITYEEGKYLDIYIDDKKNKRFMSAGGYPVSSEFQPVVKAFLKKRIDQYIKTNPIHKWDIKKVPFDIDILINDCINEIVKSGEARH